jgi:hypothetical protein
MNSGIPSHRRLTTPLTYKPDFLLSQITNKGKSTPEPHGAKKQPSRVPIQTPALDVTQDIYNLLVPDDFVPLMRG